MLLLLSFGLLPLGILAILASIQSAAENRVERSATARARLEIASQQINAALGRSVFTIRAASAAIELSPRDIPVCERTLTRLAQAQRSPGRYALYGDRNELRCATFGFVPPAMEPPEAGKRFKIDISEGGDMLRFTLYDAVGETEGAGEFTREAIARLAGAGQGTDGYNLMLTDGDDRMVLRDDLRDAGPLVYDVVLLRPIAGGDLVLGIASRSAPISPTELLMILLPVVMWLGAAIGGWLIVERLLLKPLVRMQKAVADYQPGDRQIDLPSLRTPAREIGELGLAFHKLVGTVARHEEDLEAAVDRQTRLVREVHHRVKNNLQVIASLLNLHARAVTNPEVASAYASIQRRVDALAVVHRNHFAELEENRGVALKPLISELAANLRATAPAEASGLQIRLAVGPLYATQDVSLSIAFLLTEIIEYAMLREAHTVAISLQPSDLGKALLSVHSDGLRGEAPEGAERFERIVTGLSRQLRSTMNRDPELGCYAVEVMVLDHMDD
jgi:two-component system, sensor histidine kinase PdtaS